VICSGERDKGLSSPDDGVMVSLMDLEEEDEGHDMDDEEEEEDKVDEDEGTSGLMFGIGIGCAEVLLLIIPRSEEMAAL